MEALRELIRAEEDGSISFGDYRLDRKTKREDFEYDGDLYKVKTFAEMTKLERNGMFVYESVPGTTVGHFTVTDRGVEFAVEGVSDVQITLQLEEDAGYRILVGGGEVGTMRTNMGGKLNLSLELSEGDRVPVKVEKQ